MPIPLQSCRQLQTNVREERIADTPSDLLYRVPQIETRNAKRNKIGVLGTIEARIILDGKPLILPLCHLVLGQEERIQFPNLLLEELPRCGELRGGLCVNIWSDPE